MGRIKCSLCFKKKVKKLVFDPKLPWEPSVLLQPKIQIFVPTFWMPASSQLASPQLWKVFTVKWASPGLELLEKRTGDILCHLNWWNIKLLLLLSYDIPQANSSILKIATTETYFACTWATDQTIFLTFHLEQKISAFPHSFAALSAWWPYWISSTVCLLSERQFLKPLHFHQRYCHFPSSFVEYGLPLKYSHPSPLVLW